MKTFIQGQWKLLRLPEPFGTGGWELYDLSEDPGETNDLAESSPDILGELKAAWQQYADEVGVVEISGPISRE